MNIKTQVITPVPYESLSSAQKKEICNGCGGKGGVVKPPLRIFFKTSCNHHDYGYWCGGSWMDRLKCDFRLLASMMNDCLSLPFLRALKYLPWCFLYYFGVTFVGWKFFRFAPKRWPCI